MKTKYLIIFALLSSIVFFSCEKESVVETNEQVTNKEVINKTEANLLVSSIAKLSIQKDFKDLVYQEINKKFDGDDNTLLNNLNSLIKSKNLKSANLSNDYENIVSSLNAKGLYPQIYIPHYEESKLKSSKIEDSPVYIIDALSTPDSVESFQAIYVNSNGEIEETSFLIDESFANENEVWVISFNERVNHEGNIIEDNNLKSARVGTKSEYMMKINCPNLKEIEGWVKGAPELRCVMKSAKGEISDQYFYPSKRKYIDNKWWETNGSSGRYLYYWDIESYTKTVLFAWIEVDGAGDTHEFSGSFTYKDVDKETGQEYSATANYKITYKSWDQLCGSISVNIDDGRVGEEYSTGLVKFINAYK